MHLETADPTLVSSTLSTLIPKVTISASRGSSRRGSGTGEQPGQPGAQPFDPSRDGEIARRAMERNRQGGTGGPQGLGGQGGGGRSFGGGAGGGRPQGMGGGNRPQGGTGGGRTGR
jgi:translation initiation factor IF-2